ncbi:hypothetical protein Vafri_17370 [Volvox africanus]|uniref:Uncharacterized protein n=1 Tax=Volvox africanus TaxID=51714 RepID=A0A8J4BQC3_9CHLO|nr:hypothetical protein Vafri_17370 [Volvox africanus]
MVSETYPEHSLILPTWWDHTWRSLPTPNTQHPTPNTQHPTPNTQHPTPNTQHPTPNIRPRKTRVLTDPRGGKRRREQHWVLSVPAALAAAAAGSPGWPRRRFASPRKWRI